MEVVEIKRTELLVIETGGEPEVVEIEAGELEVLEVAEQGQPGPPGGATFDDDLALIYQIAKL